MFEGKKFVAFGERDGVPGPTINEVLAAAGLNVIYQVTECFVWTASGAMDAENQSLMMRLAEEHGSDSLVVVLGAADLEGVEISAETLTTGDPSFAGPLAGVQLGLQVYHILEPVFKELVPPEIFEEKLGIFELTTDTSALGQSLGKIREQVA